MRGEGNKVANVNNDTGAMYKRRNGKGKSQSRGRKSSRANTGCIGTDRRTDGRTSATMRRLSVKRPRHTLLSTEYRLTRSFDHSLPFFLLLSPCAMPAGAAVSLSRQGKVLFPTTATVFSDSSADAPMPVDDSSHGNAQEYFRPDAPNVIVDISNPHNHRK